MERHVARCGTCAARRRALVERSEAVRSALAEWSPTVSFVGAQNAAPLHAPSRRAGLVRLWRAPALRAAAVLLALAAVAATAQPVRKWVAARWEQLRTIVAPPSAPAPPEVRAPGASEVRFTPSGPVFTIEVAARQAAGRLTIDVAGDSIASALVSGGDGSEELVVLPERLRVVNPPTTIASYHVRLPRGVDEVQVQIGTGPLRRLVTTTGPYWVFEMVSGTEVPARP